MLTTLVQSGGQWLFYRAVVFNLAVYVKIERVPFMPEILYLQIHPRR